jgi:protein O-GlcNAc transferase
MDYIIADAIVIPPDEQRFYDEQVVTLPGCYQVNDDRGRVLAARPSRTQAGLRKRALCSAISIKATS